VGTHEVSEAVYYEGSLGFNSERDGDRRQLRPDTDGCCACAHAYPHWYHAGRHRFGRASDLLPLTSNLQIMTASEPRGFHTEIKTRDTAGALVITSAGDEFIRLPPGQPSCVAHDKYRRFPIPTQQTIQTLNMTSPEFTVCTDSQTRDNAGNLKITSATDETYVLSVTGQASS